MRRTADPFPGGSIPSLGLNFLMGTPVIVLTMAYGARRIFPIASGPEKIVIGDLSRVKLATS
jgi:hypothetical protein